MKLCDTPDGSKFLDVDGIAVVELPNGECIAFVHGKGIDVESRHYPNVVKAGEDGGRITREQFTEWLKSGDSPFDLRPRSAD